MTRKRNKKGQFVSNKKPFSRTADETIIFLVVSIMVVFMLGCLTGCTATYNHMPEAAKYDPHEGMTYCAIDSTWYQNMVYSTVCTENFDLTKGCKKCK